MRRKTVMTFVTTETHIDNVYSDVGLKQEAQSWVC